MKVGTDGVLLGAWADCCDKKHILDIGTGSGLIALMMAQRNKQATIYGIDVEADACAQAIFNVQQSPFANRIAVEHTSFQSYFPEMQFDLIVSNPPYFSNSLKTPDIQRTNARHNDELPFEILIAKSVTLLHENGTLALILPATTFSSITDIASKHYLNMSRLTWVKPTPGHEPRRILIEFGFKKENRTESELIIEIARHRYSEQYIELTKEFYLKM